MKKMFYVFIVAIGIAGCVNNADVHLCDTQLIPKDTQVK
jgi:hypothetical protein